MKNTVAVVLRTLGNGLIMQQREDKPGIDYPGYTSLFGGICKKGEQPIQAAIREMHEELELSIVEQDLHLWRIYDKQAELHGSASRLHIFICGRSLDPTIVAVHEGQGIVVINNVGDMSGLKITNRAKQFIPELLQMSKTSAQKA